MTIRFRKALIAVVAAMGIAASAVADEVKVTWAYYAARNASDDVVSSVRHLHDNKFGAGGDVGGYNHFLIDCRKVTHVTKLGFARRSDDTWNRLTNFKIAGSNDGVNWDEPFHQNSEVPNADALSFVAVDVNYRYYKITNVILGNCAEFWLYTDEPALTTTGQAEPFAGTGICAADSENGVAVSGTLLNAPAGNNFKVYGYAAQEDYGDSFADWQANGVEIALNGGEGVVDGATASGAFVGLEEGRWHWRMFAVSGETVVSSLATYPFVVGSLCNYFPTAYCQNANQYTAYDGVMQNGTDRTDGMFVLDLRDIPEDYHVDGIRVWPRSDQIEDRFMPGAIDLGYETPLTAKTWNPSAKLSPDGALRTVYQAAEEPLDISWTKNAVKFMSATAHSRPSYIALPAETFINKPAYIKICRVSYFNLDEIELRIVKDPVSDCKVTIAGDPDQFGEPSPFYGGFTPPVGEPFTASVAVTEFGSEDGSKTYRLKGWKLTVQNGEGEPVVTTSTAENLNTCVFTPVLGDAVVLQWIWETIKAPVRIPARYTLHTADGTLVKQDPMALYDGNMSSYPAENTSIYQFRADFGARRRIAKVGVSSRQDTYGSQRCGNFDLEISNDGVEWTLVASNRAPLQLSVMTFYDFGNVEARYLRLKSNIVSYADFSELAAYSTDLMVRSSQAEPYADTIDAADSPDGVKAIVKLANSRAKNAFLEAYAATEDYGSDYAAWKANGVAATSLGETVDGNSRTGLFKGLAKGIWYWRAFAVQGDDIGVGNENVPFVVGSVPSAAPVAYVKTEACKVYYNGVAGHGCEAEPNNDNWIVFDLAEIPPEYRLQGMRIWGRSTLIDRLRVATIDLGVDAGADFGEATLLNDQNGRKVYQVAAEPTGIEWQASIPLLSNLHFDAETMFVFFDRQMQRLKPRYIRVRGVFYGNCNEIEFRLTKRMSGMAIIVQ